jgi:hypothetical protein
MLAKCDDVIDCLDASDEINCLHNKTGIFYLVNKILVHNLTISFDSFLHSAFVSFFAMSFFTSITEFSEDLTSVYLVCRYISTVINYVVIKAEKMICLF